MTIEQIKAEIAHKVYCLKHKYYEKRDSYTMGLYSGMLECLRMLDNLEPSWHPYPAERPKKRGLYLTCWNGGFLIQRWLTSDGFEFKIDFWKELDKPYKKDGNHV